MIMLTLQNGICILVDGVQTTLYGSLIAMLADTVAAHELGGFKVGVGFALRKCRMCLATDEDIQCKVSNISNFSLMSYFLVICFVYCTVQRRSFYPSYSCTT